LRAGIFSVADIARIFGVPPFVLPNPQSATFASSRETSRTLTTQSLMPWTAKLQRAFAQRVLSSQYRLVIDLGDLLRADPEARWASWQRARRAGVLSPNDVRLEEGWPHSNNPTADSIAPPPAGGRPPGEANGGGTPPPDEGGKIADLEEHRHVAD
jgi:phage portal protein BeeE